MAEKTKRGKLSKSRFRSISLCSSSHPSFHCFVSQTSFLAEFSNTRQSQACSKKLGSMLPHNSWECSVPHSQTGLLGRKGRNLQLCCCHSFAQSRSFTWKTEIQTSWQLKLLALISLLNRRYSKPVSLGFYTQRCH